MMPKCENDVTCQKDYAYHAMSYRSIYIYPPIPPEMTKWVQIWFIVMQETKTVYMK
jgi:hypothetical protein